MGDILIKGGTIVTSSDKFVGDILIKGEKFSAIAKEIDFDTSEVIDARGKLVIPGGIDVHTHFQLPVKGTVSADDFESGTKAAVCGGVTSFIDFAHQKKGELITEALENRINEAKNRVYIDYGLHIGITEFNKETIGEISSCIKRGAPSFKLYMVYAKEGLMSDDSVIYRMLEAVREYGGIVIVHAENPFLIDYFTDSLVEEGNVDIPNLSLSRPDFTEIEAIRRVLYLTEITKSRVYIVHVSTGKSAALISEAKGRGVCAFGETCPHYLTLTNQLYCRDDGNLFTTNPPLRTVIDQEALWKAISIGALQIVSTDHCSFTRAQKDKGKNNFTLTPNGIAGIETLLPLTFYEGVVKGRISLNQWVDCISINPAKMFGIYPQKGALIPGSDADVVIFNPEISYTIDSKKLHYKTDYCPYEGRRVQGLAEVTISRGKILYNKGKFYGEKGRGQFINRNYS